MKRNNLERFFLLILLLRNKVIQEEIKGLELLTLHMDLIERRFTLKRHSMKNTLILMVAESGLMIFQTLLKCLVLLRLRAGMKSSFMIEEVRLNYILLMKLAIKLKILHGLE